MPRGVRHASHLTRSGRPGQLKLAVTHAAVGPLAGESRTREAILDAARRRFGEQGYNGATIRGIAADAESTLVAAISPTVQRYLTGDIGPGGVSS